MPNNLRRLREAAGLTQEKAAARMNTTRNQYVKLEGGSRQLSSKWIHLAAHAFGVDPGSVVAEDTPNLTNRKVSVVGYVGLGGEVEFAASTGSVLEEIELPYGIAADCAALICRGNSQYPRVKDGEVVVYRESELPPCDLLGEEVIVWVAEGGAYLKTIVRGAVPGRFTLTSHNEPPREDVAIAKVGEILAIVPRGKWKLIR